MTLPKGVHVVRKRRRDGSEVAYYYWRPTGERLPDPSSPAFAAALRRAKLGKATAGAGTFGALIVEYKATPQFKAVSKATLAAYLSAFDRLQALHNEPVDQLRRRHALQIRDLLAGQPGNCRVTLKTLSMLMNFAVEREYREFNPVRGVKLPPLGSRRRWSDDAIEAAAGYLGEPMRRALVLALYTGQRRGDVAAMRWDQYDGHAISLVQIKTGTPLWVPCHAALRGELDEWKRTATSVAILAKDDGRPWASSNSLGSAFSRAKADNPAIAHLTFHGLRKTAGAKLAEAGCTPHEIMAVLGHKTLKEAERYTAEASQQTRASAAILKLETSFRDSRNSGRK